MGYLSGTVFCKYQKHIYRIIHELSFNINIYEKGQGNVIKCAFGEFYNMSGKSLLKVYIQMTTRVKFNLFITWLLSA